MTVLHHPSGQRHVPDRKASVRRWALATVVTAITLAVVVPLAASSETLTVAYPPANDFLPAFVAKDMGFFAKRNLDVTLNVERVSNNIPAALVGGAADIGALPPTVLLLAREGGLDLVNVRGISHHNRDQPTIALIAGKDSAIHSANDLRGKKVGVPGLYGGLDVMAREWVKSKGVPTNAVTWVEVPFPQMAEFLSRGSVDAVAAIEPFRSRLIADGAGYKLSDYVSELRGDVLLIGYAATRSWAMSHRDTIVRFNAAILEGEQYIAANPDQAKAIEAKYLGFSGPRAKYSATATADDYRFYANAMLDLGVLKKPADVNGILFTP
jgi:NitT/TauT family transport system substrate-binding protein